MYQRKYYIQQSGIALVIVLWMLTLLTVLAASYSKIMRTETRMTSHLVHKAQASAIAEAGIWYGIFSLLKPATTPYWLIDNASGVKRSLRYRGGTINLSIQDEASKININTARPNALQELIKSAKDENGEPLLEDASSLVYSIIDWRDKDKRSYHNSGAEDDTYAQQDYAYGAKDGPFNSVDELQFVIGMTAALFKHIKPSVTVYSKSSKGQSSMYRKVSDKGTTAPPLDTAAKAVDATADPYINEEDRVLLKKAIKGNTFNISSTGRIANTIAMIRTVVLIGDKNKPFSILYWSEE